MTPNAKAKGVTRMKASKFQRDKSKGLRHRDLANSEEATDRTPAADPPTEAEAPLGAAPAETRHTAVAIDLRDRAQTRNRIFALLLRVFGSEGEDVLDLGCRPRICGIGRFDFLLRILRRDVVIEVEVSGFVCDDAFALDRESLRGDVVILPVVVTGGDHLLERLAVVDGEDEDVGSRRILHIPCGFIELECNTNGITIAEISVRIENIGENAAAQNLVESFRCHLLLTHRFDEFRQLTISED